MTAQSFPYGEGAAVCCVGVEVTTAFARAIRERSPFKCRMSEYAPGGVELFRDETVQLLEQLKQIDRIDRRKRSIAVWRGRK